jgi:hypothetical protein
MNIGIKYGLIIMAFVFLLIVPRELIFKKHLSVCIFKNITNIECPFCGMTRASYDMVHLHPIAALHYNPVSLFLPLILVIEIIFDVRYTSKLKLIRKIIFYSFLFSLSVLFAMRIFRHFYG